MMLPEVRRPAETLQFADGMTGRFDCAVRWKHWNQVLNSAFLDGHARRVTREEWNQVDRDASGYFYHISAADR